MKNKNIVVQANIKMSKFHMGLCMEIHRLPFHSVRTRVTTGPREDIPTITKRQTVDNAAVGSNLGFLTSPSAVSGSKDRRGSARSVEGT